MTGRGLSPRVRGNPEPPELAEREWLNKRTGELQRVPRGIDPGFARNVGLLDPVQAARRLQQEKLRQADWPELAGAMSDPVLDDYVLEGREVRRSLLGGRPAGELADEDLLAFRADLVRELRQRRGAGRRAARLRPTKSADEGLASARRLVLEGAALLPESWVRAGNASGPIGVRLHKVEGRGRRDPAQRTLHVPSGDPGIAVHEYAHHLQDAMPGLLALADELHVRRTTHPDGRRHLVRRLRLYGSDVVGQDDLYYHPYVGRRYDDDGGRATEVLTMGLQTLFHPLEGKSIWWLRKMIAENPDVADLLIGLLLHYDP